MKARKVLYSLLPGTAWAVVLLAGLPLAASATNRCVTATGKILYTDAECVSTGAKHDREVRSTVSVIGTSPKSSVSAGSKTPAKDAKPEAVFKKSPKAPVLVVCYDPKNARADVSHGDIDSAIRSGIQTWNDGCNVTWEYMGECATEVARHDRPVDYKVWWAVWDDTMMGRGNGDTMMGAREHAIAAASPRVGVALNREIAGFPRQFRRSIAHEFGHVVGVGHSVNPTDLMYSGGRAEVASPTDLAGCNEAVATRFGVKSE